MEKELVCPNCGALVELHKDKCPYCGYINEIGAEEHYMNKLSAIKENLNRVDDNARKEYSKEIGVTLKSLIKVLIVVLILCAICLLLFAWVSAGEKKYLKEAEDTASLAENLKWRKEAFAQYDELYNNGEYIKIAELMSEAESQEKDIYSWEHYPFISVYKKYMQVKDVMLPDMVAEGCDEYLAAELTYACFYYYYEIYITEYGSGNRLTEDEKAILKANREYIVGVVHDRLKFSDEQMKEFKDNGQVLGNSYLAYADCKKLAKKYYSQFE